MRDDVSLNTSLHTPPPPLRDDAATRRYHFAEPTEAMTPDSRGDDYSCARHHRSPEIRPRSASTAFSPSGYARLAAADSAPKTSPINISAIALWPLAK